MRNANNDSDCVLLALLAFVVFLGMAHAQPAGQPHMDGNWKGTLETGGPKLRLVLHIVKSADQWSGSLDSLDQGAIGLKLSSVTVTGNHLHCEMNYAGAAYDGDLSANGQEIIGTWKQGTAMKLNLRRGTDAAAELKRPQHPKGPFPYKAEDVLYENQPAGVKLAGTLTIPPGAGPFPVALMITGSGLQDRDETVFGHKPFWVIADYLARRGLAVLRVDDRGAGQSTGSLATMNAEDMVDDVLAGVAYLKTRKELDPRRIGLIGHSEGGMVGPMAAVRSSDISFVVMLAGPGVRGDELLYDQAARIMTTAGAPPAQIEANRKIQEKLFHIIHTETDEHAAAEQVRAVFAALGLGKDAIEAQVKTNLSPEMRSLVNYDPAPVLGKVKCPVLAMNGALDLQVSAKLNLPGIAAALAAGGNPDITIVSMPNLNHLFQHAKTGLMQEYSESEETFAPQALQVLGDWLVLHCK